MKPLLCLLAVSLLAGVARAQTNTAAVAKTPSQIFSDTGEFDLQTHVAVYRGNVRVQDPQMTLTCDILTARQAAEGGRVDNIVAENNVVVDMVDEHGQTNRATGDKMVYTYKVENGVTNDVAVLTGHAQAELGPGQKMDAVSIRYDRLHKTISTVGGHMISTTDLLGNTNAPAAPVDKPSTNQ